MFEAKIIADSAYNGSRLTTFQLRYPRFIHSELMTHRVFSRNAASSRAIPVQKMIDQVRDEPAMPVYWGKNQKGMQADEELSEAQQFEAKSVWISAGLEAIQHAKRFIDIGVHKQIANRILEPWQWMSTIVTSSRWDNFYQLRVHPDAQPEFQHIARMMKAVHEETSPRELNEGDYHLPYITKDERDSFNIIDLVRMSVARCARVSYLTHDKKVPEIAEDLDLYDRLVAAKPFHASPTEHQARPNTGCRVDLGGNFDMSWVQFRKLLEIGQETEF